MYVCVHLVMLGYGSAHIACALYLLRIHIRCVLLAIHSKWHVTIFFYEFWNSNFRSSFLCAQWYTLTVLHKIISQNSSFLSCDNCETKVRSTQCITFHYYPGEDTCDPERSLVRQDCQESIKDFWHRSPHIPTLTSSLIHPDDVWRCWTCGRG